MFYFFSFPKRCWLGMDEHCGVLDTFSMVPVWPLLWLQGSLCDLKSSRRMAWLGISSTFVISETWKMGAV